MKGTLVTIVIPAYNASRTVTNTIRSIIGQTYENIEIIVVNDGSTDNTIDIVRQLSNSDYRIRIINKINEGVSVARNIGIYEAKGEFISFVDSDDWVERDYVETLLSALQTYNADVSKCAIKYITDNRHRVRVRNVPDTVCPGIDAYSQFLCGRGWASSACAALYNLKFLRNNNIFFPTGIPVGEDGIFTLNILLKAVNIVSINRPLLNVLVREKSASRSGSVYDISHQIVDEKDDSLEFKDFRDAYKLRVITSNLLRTAYRTSYKEFMEIHKIALLDNFTKLNTAKNRRKLNSIMKLSSLLAKSPTALFYGISLAKVLGIKPLF